MHNFKLLPPLTILMLSGCATSTPIAVSTPHWVVPAPDKELSAQESQAQAQLNMSLQAWSKWLLSLPTQDGK